MNKRDWNCRSLETAHKRLVKARLWRHIFNFGPPDQMSEATPGGLLLQVRPSPPFIGRPGCTPPTDAAPGVSEPQAQPPDRHSPPLTDRSGQASHQEEMRSSVWGVELGRIGVGVKRLR